MSIISKIVAILVLASAANADGISNPKSGGSGGGQVGFIEGINNLGIGGSGGGGGGCPAGQLNFSNPCNTTQYMVILK